RPRPAGRSGCATTKAMSKRASISASSEAAANSGVPRKTRRTGASGAARPHGGGREVGAALFDRLQLLLEPLAAQHAQAIDEQHAIQVIHFVLHGAGEEPFAGEHHGLALLTQRTHVDLGGALEAVVDAGNRETALVVVLGARGVLVHGIDESDVQHLLALLGNAEHGDAQAHAHLGRGEADAIVGVHGLVHVLDQLAVLVGDLRDRRGFLAQYGIAEDAERSQRHQSFETFPTTAFLANSILTLSATRRISVSGFTSTTSP